MGYYYTAEPENAVPPKSWATPKTHVPGSPVKERGLRFYIPESGRWASRDPMEESGSGLCLYAYVKNRSLDRVDLLGLIDADAPLAEIEALVRRLIAQGRSRGMNVAADMLQNFLNGGGDQTLPVPWLRGFSRVTDAETRNQIRFQESLEDIAIGMSAGTTRIHNDHWDALITYRGRAFSTEEMFWASGDSTLTSTGNFTLKANACEVNISGVVKHHWRDDYNWNPGMGVWIPGEGSVPDEAIDRLRTEGTARTFGMSADWEQTATGVVRRRLWGLFYSIDWDWTGP